MTTGLSVEQRERFADQGYLVVPGLLDVETDLAPVKQSYIQYLDNLADIYMGEANPDLRADYAARPFAERFALLLGCSGGMVLHHLAPGINIYRAGFQWRPDLPSAQIPALFWLMRNKTLLDAVESLIGPEIDASPIFYVNLKLAPRHMELAETVARTSGQENPNRQPSWTFNVETTKWHIDAAYSLPNAYDVNMVNAWIPMTDARSENSCLLVVPGSHRKGILHEPIPSAELENALTLPAGPGDVVFLHNRILHGSTANRTDRDHRWAFNFRYLPTGEPPSPTIFLPSFVARSRALPERELRDPLLWSQMWHGALNYAAMNLLPLRRNRQFSLADADAVTAHWRAKISEPTDWLRLDEVTKGSLLARARLAITCRRARPADPKDRLLVEETTCLGRLREALRRSPTAMFVLAPLVRLVRRWVKRLRVMKADRAASVTLPDDTRIVPPSADVPADLAAYSGAWSGRWWGKAPMMYVFERIEPDGTAQMVYAWPDYQTWKWKSGHQRHEVQLKSDQFSFSNQWGTYRQRILPDGRMRSDYNGSPSHEGSSGRGTAILTRVD